MKGAKERTIRFCEIEHENRQQSRRIKSGAVASATYCPRQQQVVDSGRGPAVSFISQIPGRLFHGAK